MYRTLRMADRMVRLSDLQVLMTLSRGMELSAGVALTIPETRMLRVRRLRFMSEPSMRDGTDAGALLSAGAGDAATLGAISKRGPVPSRLAR